MKISLYFNYTSRSLLRGGQRTILAIFCVAVGVMAVVALQLVGFMLQNSLTSNVRASNGGDIAVSAAGEPLKASDLAFFKQLKSAGTISNYSAVINLHGALTATASAFQAFNVQAVDPGNFPLVEQPAFVQPTNGTLSGLLSNGQVLVTQSFVDKYQKQVGSALTVYIKSTIGSGQTLHVTIAGILANTGIFAQSGNLVLVSAQDYLAAASTTGASYSQVDVTTPNQAATDTATRAINAHFPLVSTSTVAQVLKSEKASLDLITKFLEITGLLSLLIGGVGIVNTMQVLLSRRKTEIAMLKTTGYRRGDLYLLFGLEAGLLGLVGGLVGSAAATGVSYLVRGLLQSTGGLNIPFVLSPAIIGGGLAIGFATALIFGLLPIVQAANVRPLSVIRDLETHRVGSFALTILLLLVLSVLFCLLATVILNNDLLLGVEATYGTFAVLLVLSAFFGLIVLAVSKMPVPEHFQFKQILLVLLGIVLAVLVYQLQPVFGLCLLAASLLGIVVVLLPVTWKVSLKMALRNLGRRRARTATTMLALFIGIFGIGLVVNLGLDLQSEVSGLFAQKLPYNIIVSTSGSDTATLHTRLSTLPGLNASRQDSLTRVLPSAINGQSLQKALPAGADRQTVAGLLSSVEGYHLAQNVPSMAIVRGRNLNASDVGTNHVLISELLTSTGQINLNLKLGDTITFLSADGKTLRTVMVVGVFSRAASFTTLGGVLASSELVNALSSARIGVTTVTYMKVDLAQVNHTLDALGNSVPNASVESLADVGAGFAQQLNGILEVLVAIASLSVIAAVIIIANAVALAMLERRRELGILKSVGYTSGTVLSEVMIENGIVGAVGAFIAMLLAAGGVILLGSQVFNLTLSVSPLIVVGMVAGSALLAMLTAVLVSWQAVRVRPLAVLRYE